MTDDVEGVDASFRVKNTDIRQEDARQKLAYFLTSVLSVEVLFALTATWLPCRVGLQNLDTSALKDIMTIVFAPTVALVGSAAGFYFGRNSEKP